MSPPLGGVVHDAQSSPAAQPGHVRHTELRADVASTEDDPHVRRRVAAERDAPQYAGDRLHERQRPIFVVFVVDVAALSRPNTVRLAAIDFGTVVVD